MSEREELARVLNPALGGVIPLDWSVVEGSDFLTMVADAVLASPWLRAHDDRIRAEALAPVLALADEWLAADTDRKAFVVQCGDALRAAAGTPTHHTTEEES